MLSIATKEPLSGDLDSMEVLHQVMRFVPYNRRTLCALRCVSKPYRRAVQHPKGPWSNNEEIMISKYGQCIIFNAKDDEEGRSNFRLSSISPIGRKFRTISAKMLNRYHQCIADGLTRLVLHHSQIDTEFFYALGPLTNLKALELVACRGITSVAEATRAANLESLEVNLCPLVPDGVSGLFLPKLKCLKLQSCHKLSCLNGIAKETVASLEELCIENCNVSDETADQFFKHFTSKLRALHIPGSKIDTALASIPEDVRAHGLTSLNLNGTPLRFETLCELIPFMQDRLEFLSLKGCKKLLSFEPLGRLKELRFLDVSDPYSGEGLHFLTSCVKLELFRMANSPIEDIMFLSSLQVLRVLDAPHSCLNDPSLMFLENLPMLDTVVLTGCMQITNINVLGTCPKIRRIFCAGTTVTNEGIALLRECLELEELDLKLTDVTDVNFLIDCPSLKSLNVCEAVRDVEGFQLLLRKKGLKVICDSLDSRGDVMDPWRKME